jgi:Fe-S cluster assembly protein SufB
MTKPMVEVNEEYERLYGFKMPERYVYKARQGLSLELVKEISQMKGEPEWMTKFRLRSLEHFLKKPMPSWANLELLNQIQFDAIYYYLKPIESQGKTWEGVPEEIKRTFDRLGIPEAERKFLAGVSAQYECLTGDTRVLTDRSATPIKDIEPGSFVYSLNEQTRQLERQRVKGLMRKGERPVYEVVVAGRTIKATANHPLLALTYTRPVGRLRGRFGTQWTYLSELKAGDYVALAKELPDEGRRYPLPAISFESSYDGRNQAGSFSVTTTALLTRAQTRLRIPEYTTESFMWFLGVFLGDGFLHRSHAKAASKSIVDIAIPSADAALRARLRNVLAEVFGYETDFDADPYRVRIHAKPIARLIEVLGLDLHAHTKRLPSWVFSLPKSQKRALLGGVIDADGYVRKTNTQNDVSITSCNRALLSDLHLLAVTCGFRVSQIHEFQSPMVYRRIETLHTGYRIYLYGDLSPLKPHSVRCERDVVARQWYHKYSGAMGSPITAHTSDYLGFAKIESIKPAGVEPVYDIEVEGHHNFVAEGLIVHNSESVYHSIREDLEKQGVIFLDMDSGLKQHPEIIKRYFGTVIPPADNKFAALNSAVWSGGSFVYVPKGVHVELPLQAYFRINAESMGQFERTLIVTEEGSSVHYIEGCTAPIYAKDSLHSAVVELVAQPHSRLRYTTIQNWSKNVYNLVTKRGVAYENARVEWLDGNLGSKLTMKYPGVYMMGRHARGEVLSVAFAGEGQHQDAGAKMIHAAPETSSVITSKSISKAGGRTSYRGLVKVHRGAEGSKSTVRCDALLLDPESRSDTYPTMEIDEQRVQIGHEATVSKIGEEQLFYLMSRGLSEQEAMTMVVNGFIEPFVKELPLEYAVELNRLVALEMEGSVG